MSHPNPTPLKVGMAGNFAGKPYSIIARVVMSMEEEGETYFWNEFYLSDGSDKIAMLVCEEAYGAQQWRLFTEFTPATPISARDAALKQVGNRVELEGVSAEVTVVDESKVAFIEGRAPDWVAVGDVAQYFNAEASGKMWVVSWSGDEVEYYRGMQLHPEMVAQALGLPVTDFKQSSGVSSHGGWNAGLLAGALLLGVTGFFVLGRACNSGVRHSSSSAPAGPVAVAVKREPAPNPPLRVGMEVNLDGRMFRVAGHRVVENTQVNGQWSSHHYQVTDGGGEPSLLVVRARPGEQTWQLLKPLIPLRPPTPLVAGAMRVGEAVTLDSFAGKINALFMARTMTNSGAAADNLGAGLTYHYLARNETELLLASWNGERIVFHRGAPVAKHTP